MNFLVSTRSNAMHTMIVYMNYFFSNRLSCHQYHNRIVFNKFMHIFFFMKLLFGFLMLTRRPREKECILTRSVRGTKQKPSIRAIFVCVNLVELKFV